MISKIQIKNFKSFRDTGIINLKPITILVGPNSSGKSSLMKSLLLLKQTVESPDNNSALVPNGPLVKLGGYSNFINNRDNSKKLEITLTFNHSVKIDSKGDDIVKGSFSFNYEERNTKILLNECKINLLDYSYKIWKQDKEYVYSINKNSDKNKKSEPLTGVIPRKFFDVYIPDTLLNKIQGENNYFFPMRFFIDSFFDKVYYIGPLRKNPQRIYFPSGDAPRDVGKSGERAIDALWYSNKDQESNNTNLETIVKEWFQKFGFSSDVKLNLLETVNSIYEIVVGEDSDHCIFNISDVGFGVSQTLPIIIECFYAPKDSVILIEQPEIHLHPKAQATLGDLFIESVLDGKRQLIIETHSEHLLSRIRRRIADDSKISANDVSILYFLKENNETIIHEIPLDEYGQYANIFPGFFEEEYEESLAHLKAISRKMKHD